MFGTEEVQKRIGISKNPATLDSERPYLLKVARKLNSERLRFSRYFFVMGFYEFIKDIDELIIIALFLMFVLLVILITIAPLMCWIRLSRIVKILEQLSIRYETSKSEKSFKRYKEKPIEALKAAVKPSTIYLCKKTKTSKTGSMPNKDAAIISFHFTD